MTDREKVIRGLECIGGYRHMDGNRCAECGYNECQTFAICLGEAARDALELLKEQEPKLVRYTASTVRCPNCNKQITTKGCIHREINYCWKCGQAVKWND